MQYSHILTKLIAAVNIKVIAMLDYRKTREQAVSRRRDLRTEITRLSGEQVKIQSQLEQARRELAAVDGILESLDFLSSGAPLEAEQSGMADRVRHTLQQTNEHLLPTQLRDLLTAAGVRSSSSKNLLIGVHNILSRLEPHLDTKEINGRTAYKWKQPAKRGDV